LFWYNPTFMVFAEAKHGRKTPESVNSRITIIYFFIFFTTEARRHREIIGFC